jgi:acyl-CoA thioester hydrolase
MHRYVLEHRVSHADVDLLGELKVAALLGLLEQAAVEASWDAGFDPAYYTSQGRVWIIRRTRFERLLPVGGGDRLAVATHVLDWRRARSLRSYDVRRVARDGDTQPLDDAPQVARATTDWVYCDMTSGRPASVPDEMRRGFSGEELAMLPRARALPDEAPGTPVEMTLDVRPSLLDHVTHVNNAAYAAMLEDGAFALFAAHGLGVDEMLALGGALRVRRMDLEYLDDAVAGDALVVRSWLVDDAWPNADATAPAAAPAAIARDADGVPRAARLMQTIARRDGGRIMRAASDWVWRRRPAVLGGVPH